VYQVTPTPESWATSSRRNPGVRRRKPGGIPTSAGVTRARLLRRKAASSGRRRCVVPIVTSPIVDAWPVRCQVLSVPAPRGSRHPYRSGGTLDGMTTTPRSGPGAAPVPSTAISEAPGTDKGPRPLLAVVLAGLFMALLDVFIVNVAAPTIGTELHASGAELQLVVAGYTITYSVLLITGARLGDRFGHGRVHLAGMALFTAASLACGLAQGATELIVFRLIQGAGSAVMIPQVLSLIQRNFVGEARVKALGAYSAVLAVGAAAGQILGGVLVSADLLGTGWRPVFLVNVPVGAVLLIIGRRVLPRERGGERERGRGMDLPGLVLLGAAVSLFTVPLVLGQEEDWPLWSWLSLGVGALVFAVFCGYESRLARRGGALGTARLARRGPRPRRARQGASRSR